MSRNLSGLDLYLNRMPFEARRAIDGLNSEVRLAVVMALSEHGRLRFSDLQSMLGTTKQILAFHLNRLVETGIVSHVYGEFPNEDRKSFYRLTELGESLVGNIQAAFVPSVRPAAGLVKPVVTYDIHAVRLANEPLWLRERRLQRIHTFLTYKEEYISFKRYHKAPEVEKVILA